jgi:tetratricopeptide (TPR) repeat protein
MNGHDAASVPGSRVVFGLLLILNVLVVYSNHFRNDFHFDDLTAICDNPAIRDPATIAKAFVDPTAFSSAPGQRTYRPVTTASLTVDYWLAGGLNNTFFFHLSTFFWFSVQLVLMFLLFERLMNRADPHPSNYWTALAAAAAFGMHPANAETVNYIIQRADLYNALGCVASLWLFIRYPAQRRLAWYLLPAAAAMLAKPPALVFPLLLLAYVLLFEQDGVPARRKWKSALASVLPALLLAAAIALLQVRMQAVTWSAGTVSPLAYRLTQPFVALHYFQSFFLPAGLNVDPAWHYIAPFSLQAIAGYLFVIALALAAVASFRTRRGKPVAFGIIWFFITLAPTSLTPLSDVTNDHRMFFPFVGLALAVFWSLRLLLFRQTARLTRHPLWVRGSVVALAAVLIVAGAATRGRNRVWSTERNLWLDATEKNPRNHKAWTNYGSALYRQGDYEATLSAWNRAASLDPASPLCQANLIRVLQKLHRGQEAETHFQRLLALGPSIPDPYIAYAEWLGSVGRFTDARSVLDSAARLYPDSPPVRHAHLQLYLDRDAADRIAVLKALAPDHDLTVSAGDILAAPAALAALDRNGDGKLSAEECGADFGDESRLDQATLRRMRREFMQSQPVLLALDADGDGEISAREIGDASKELASLDRSGAGLLRVSELDPPWVVGEARRILALLDRNRDGRIGQDERSSPAAEPFRELLSAADIDQDGVVILDELIEEIFYRADRNKDGTVTAEEMNAAIRSGLLGSIPTPPADRTNSRCLVRLSQNSKM